MAVCTAMISAYYWTAIFALSWGLATQRPSFVNNISLKIKGDEECVRISEYQKPEVGPPCKDLGQCFQYRCGAIARHCSACEAYKGPCIDYAKEEGSEQQRNRRDAEHHGHNATSSSMTSFMQSITSSMQSLMKKVRAVVQSVSTPLTVRIETIGNTIVHLQAGLKNCTGFITRINSDLDPQYVILTAAQCLISYETKCQSGMNTFGEGFRADASSGTMVDGFMMYPYSHSWPCFGDYDADVTKVKKGFRSYAVLVTSYMGRSYTLPLDSRHVIIPRDYMECQDCRFDFAGIKLENEMATTILRGHDPFVLAPDKDPMEWTGDEVTQFVTVKGTHNPRSLWKAVDTKFCTINYATKEKMCFNLPIAPNMQEEPELLPGSPLFVTFPNQQGNTELHCIGIFTETYVTAQEDLSTEHLIEDGIKSMPEGSSISLSMRYSKNGAVRVTQQLVSMLEKLCDDSSANSTQKNVTKRVKVFPSRREYFPNAAQPYDMSEYLSLCSLGWKDEKIGCTRPDAKLIKGCRWDGSTFKCAPRMRKREITEDEPRSLFQDITIPGTTKHLSLRGQGLSDNTELMAVLEHLPNLVELILDYNNFEILLPPLLDKNPGLQMISFKHNKIYRLHSDILRYTKKLQHINLSYNRIKILPPYILQRALVLQYINLEQNNINVISPKHFAKNRKLDRIYLGHNNITYFPQKIIKYQVFLKEFWINNNNIKRIMSLSFYYNPKLTLIDLSHNHLAIVPRVIFERNPLLQYVNLNYNKISLLPLRLFQKQKRLKSVSASQNPLLAPNKTRRFFESSGVPYS